MKQPEKVEPQDEKPTVKAKKVKAPPPFSPIIAEHHIGWVSFRHRRPHPSARVARVYVTAAGKQVVYWPDEQPTVGELLWSGFRTVYEVDLGKHHMQIETDLPSQGDEFSFHATIGLLWRVTDPAKVVLDGLSDVREAISLSLFARLREVTRRHLIRCSENAESAANKELDDNTLGDDFGLSIKAFVRLTLDDDSLEHAATNRRVSVLRDIIAAGDVSQFALQLAMKPADVAKVVEALTKERDEHRKATVLFLNQLLKSEVLDRWQVDDQVRAALELVKDSVQKVLPGTDGPQHALSGHNGSGST